MTTDELMTLITSPHKWYAGVMSKSYASQIRNAHIKGKLSKKRYECIFAKFGYTIDKSIITWKQQK